MNSPFQTLGLPVTANAAQIRAAHKSLWRQHHPDRVPMNLPDAAARRAQAHTRLANINAARDALLKKNGKLTPLARQLRRQHERGAGATVHHERHTFYQGGQAVGSVDVIYAEATNAAMRELLEQIVADVSQIIGAGAEVISKKKRR